MVQSACVRSLSAVAVAAAFAFFNPASAQSWPDKPVRLIVPFSPGGGTDIQARLLSKNFHESTGQTFVIDNRTGAGGLIGAQITVDSPADGYTLLFTTATLAVNTTLFGKRMKFSAVKDLAPVSWVSSAPLVLIVHPSVPVKSVKDLIDIARAKPGIFNSGVNTPGSTSHLSAEMLKQMAKVDNVIVPFKGGGPAVAAVMSGEVDFLFATAPSAMPHIRSGKVKAIAVTTAKKASGFPELPTINTVLPGFESDNWYAMFFPAGTPADVVTRMNGLVVKALSDPAVRKFYKQEGTDPVGSTPAELSAHLKKEIAKYAKIIKQGNIRVQ
jgi:tripartite-type tricarboxylate transporter receptor subunit TctC